jgi:hypothetical protein
MNNNPNTPTRSKSPFSDENCDDDTSPVVVLPRSLFWFLVLFGLFSGATLVWMITQADAQESQNLPHVIKIDGGCTIEANAVTLKGTANSYRILPVDSPPPKR